jgi:Anp1
MDLPHLLILTPVKDGCNFLLQYFKNLLQLQYPLDLISLGFLESDSKDDTFAVLNQNLPALRTRFRRANLYKRDYGFQLSGPRWENSIQIQRRSILAKSRNFLLSKCLEDETWVLWLDVDLLSYPEDIIQQLLATNKDIITPECVLQNTDRSYDLNTFKLKIPTENDKSTSSIMDEIKMPPKGEGRLYLEDLRDFELVEVDSVGTTMLLVNADLHREGLNFPSYSYKGYLESEGLAIMAKDMGVKSWGLPQCKTVHFDH